MKKVLTALTLLLATVCGAVASQDQPTIDQLANKIDHIVVANLKTNQIKLPPAADDTTWVRRAYLDIVGRTPTNAEIEAFVTSPDHGKLIEQLVNSQGYVNHLFNFWGDLLRLRENLSDNNGNVRGDAYIEWVRQQIVDDTPYDQVVSQLLLAEGNIWTSPQTGYLLRDVGMPLDSFSNTSQVFLGVDMSCAQCHDHPFGEWTQKDFYNLAAFFAQVQTRYRDPVMTEAVRTLRASAQETDKQGDNRAVQNRLNQYLRTVYEYGVTETPQSVLKLPHDYAYDDAEPNSVVQASTMFGQRVEENRDREQLRNDFVKWLIADDNPTFSINITNRLWNHVMGAPNISPMNDIYLLGDFNQPINEKLVGHLSQLFVELDYSVKDFLQVLYNTQVYRRVAYQGPVEDYRFQGPLVRRMTAAQLWDSYLTWFTGDPDANQLNQVHDKIIEFASADISQLTVDQAIDNLDTINGLRRQHTKDVARMGPWLAVRAAHINRDGPNMSVLREFGHSDRKLIDSSSTEGSITQVLLLMNSPLVSTLASPQSNLVKTLDQIEDSDKRVNVLFNTTLGRPATANERDVFDYYLSNKDYKQAIWALVNCHESKFIF